MMFDARHKKQLLAAAVIAGAATLSAVALSRGLAVRQYTETTDQVAAPVRLALLSDLHSSQYGRDQETLIRAIRRQNPDIILLAGDIADDKVPHDGTKQLLSVIGGEYPCYYVSGNHECRSCESAAIKEFFRFYGVTVLEGDTALVTVRGQTLQICGVDDPERFVGSRTTGKSTGWSAQLQRCQRQLQSGLYSVLLSHRPELTAQYRDSGFDLVVAGHAHGGQVRVPFLLNGLFAPNQGGFPAYAGGRYSLGSTCMIVSRGLCKNSLPRVFNPPELVMITLLPKN